MASPEPHRKRVKHYDQRGEIHELTFSCYRRLPLLEDDWRREQLTLSIDRACQKQGWQLTAFVYMPEHVHLLVFPQRANAKVSKLLLAIKRPFSYRVKQQLQATGADLLNELTIRQRPGKQTFRFWQEGPGYDRNIRTEKVLRSILDYIHKNPVRRKLVTNPLEYRWSSARWYALDGRSLGESLPRLSAVPPSWFAGDADFTTY